MPMHNAANTRNATKAIILALCLLLAVFAIAGCGSRKTFTILSGSENETLEPILHEYAKKNGFELRMVYKGSLEIMEALQSDTASYDAVWPANSLWINLGDTDKKVRDVQSIMNSPIVFGIRKPLAQQLGFVGRDVSIRDILQAIEDGQLTFMMTSATQSNSGASAYIGFIYALLGNPDAITESDLQDLQLQASLKKLLGGVNRSSGSSGWLKDLFLKGDYDSMVNYESMIIEANQALVAQGREPLYAVYPYDGLTVADSPLGYVDNGDEKKYKFFQSLQQYLLSETVQKQILAQGRRTGFGGQAEGADTAIFNPDWGIDAAKTVSGIRMPSSSVIMEALNLYQSELKKPSYTVYCLDYSGSMKGDGARQMTAAMDTILDQQTARKLLLQATADDVIVVIPFDDAIIDTWTVQGSSSDDLSALAQKINGMKVGGGTNIYAPSIRALDLLSQVDLSRYTAAVVLMTDGNSNSGSFDQLRAAYSGYGMDVPIFSIEFGSASHEQLNDIANLTRARIFDGKSDLIAAFKSVRGYN